MCDGPNSFTTAIRNRKIRTSKKKRKPSPKQLDKLISPIRSFAKLSCSAILCILRVTSRVNWTLFKLAGQTIWRFGPMTSHRTGRSSKITTRRNSLTRRLCRFLSCKYIVKPATKFLNFEDNELRTLSKLEFGYTHGLL